MKKNEAINNFIDTKYIPLEKKFKILLAVAVFVLPALIFYLFFLSPNFEEIERLENKKRQLTTQLHKVQNRAKDLPKLEADLAQVQNEFAEKSLLLPKEKEIPQLLRDISSLGRHAGLDFIQFKPMPSVPRDFYAEIPVSINVRGPYHNVGAFFDRVSKLERIVSVSNVKMSSPKLEGGEMLLNSDCRLVTYQFTNKELPKQNKKKR
ncbi:MULTISPECIES: type 4a pilus biogenesis protein PilO [Desulfosediminicola]|uniref:type 4a pilus biogenesis protein PilO n=1 Tax=Desulfosediminicola TaxID=2886823 RepID=UPI0010AB64B8|nr:type 4a pilus biogenesis protein PilO [Desulfosediminicola ganghwensis]